MAHYEPSTGRIVAKKGTLAYWHEYRHKIQHKQGHIDLAEMGIRWFTYLFAFLVAILSEYRVLTIAFLLLLVPEMYLEVDAWIYSFRKKWGKNAKI